MTEKEDIAFKTFQNKVKNVFNYVKNSQPSENSSLEDFETHLRSIRNALKRIRSVLALTSDILLSYNISQSRYTLLTSVYNQLTSLYFSVSFSLANSRARVANFKRVRDKENDLHHKVTITSNVESTQEPPADSQKIEPIIRQLPIVLRIANKEKRRHFRKNRNLHAYIISVSFFYFFVLYFIKFRNLIFVFIIPQALQLFLFYIFSFSPHVLLINFIGSNFSIYIFFTYRNFLLFFIWVGGILIIFSLGSSRVTIFL